MRKALSMIPWWTVALIVVTARLAVDPNWSIVAALAILLVRGCLRNVLAHKNKQTLLSDTARLAHLETEVRALSSALTFKNLGRG